MSLLYNAFEPFVIMDKIRTPDGEGGFIQTWMDGATFRAAITYDTSLAAQTAEKAGVTSLYTITTDKAVVLEYHDVVRRQGDNKIFRITSDGDDKFTPDSASFQVRQVRAEEWSLT